MDLAPGLGGRVRLGGSDPSRPQDRAPISWPLADAPPNPAELFESQAFADLLSYLSEQYDLIVVDAPPILAVTDAAIIGQKTGITLMLVRHLVTTKPELQSALKGLEIAGIVPAGVIINQYDVAKSRYGQYGTRYGYHYGAYNYKYSSES